MPGNPLLTGIEAVQDPAQLGPSPQTPGCLDTSSPLPSALPIATHPTLLHYSMEGNSNSDNPLNL